MSGYSPNFLIFPARDISHMLSSVIKRKCMKDMSIQEISFSRKIFPGHPFSRKYRYSSSMVTRKTSRSLRDIDAVSMAHSLEVRLPLLDHRIVEWYYPFPTIQNLGMFQRYHRRMIHIEKTGAKKILIDSFRDLLPQDIDLQVKHGFGMPFENSNPKFTRVWLKIMPVSRQPEWWL